MTFEHQGGGARQEDRKAQSEASWAGGFVESLLPIHESARHGSQDSPLHCVMLLEGATESL